MNEDYYSLFGLETPAGNTAGTGNAVDDPPPDDDAAADGSSNTGADGEGDNLDDNLNGAESDGAGDDAGNNNAPGKVGGDPNQSDAANANAKPAAALPNKQRNGEFAAARRRAESEAASKIDAQIRDMGMQNPYTGKAITNLQELNEYGAQHNKAQTTAAETELGKAGLSGDVLNRLISEHPAVKAAQAALLRMDSEREASRGAAVRAEIEGEIKVIAALGLDPELKTIEDLPKIKNFEQFRELVKRGNSITDAYKLVNFDALSRRSADAAAQQTRNSASGKNHLARSDQRGAGALPVPEDVKREFLALNPGAKDAEIAAYYNKYMSGVKK